MRRVVDLWPLEAKGGRLRPTGTAWTVDVHGGERRRLSISGVDDAQRPWRFETDTEGALWMTKLWRGDLDGNGREDLLIGTIENKCGRCVDGAVATVLLFQNDGRPLPWTVPTHYGYRHENLDVQPFLTDLDRNGKAELIQVSCKYGENMSEVRKILGVYEARDGRMLPVERVSARAVRRASDGATLSPRASWQDQHAGLEGNANLHIEKLIGRETGCCMICIDIDESGRAFAAAADPCEGKREDRALYSDGVVRNGWPSTIWDGPDGRTILTGADGAQMRRLLALHADVQPLGDPKSPDWLWVHTTGGQSETPLRQNLVLEPADKERPVEDFGLNFQFSTDGPYASESVIVQLMPERSMVRLLRTSGRGLHHEREFTTPFEGAILTGATSYGEGYLVQWKANRRTILTLHDDEGVQIGAPQDQSFDGELLWDDSYSPITFLIREKGKPKSIFTMRSHVEWSH